MRFGPARRVVDAGSRKQAQRNAGLIPPEPPFYDVRTPEYTVFDTIHRTPWECVRGIDRSFGYNRESGEEHFLTRRELLWSLVDIAAASWLQFGAFLGINFDGHPRVAAWLKRCSERPACRRAR
jgi:hypothetical protein